MSKSNSSIIQFDIEKILAEHTRQVGNPESLKEYIVNPGKTVNNTESEISRLRHAVCEYLYEKSAAHEGESLKTRIEAGNAMCGALATVIASIMNFDTCCYFSTAIPKEVSDSENLGVPSICTGVVLLTSAGVNVTGTHLHVSLGHESLAMWSKTEGGKSRTRIITNGGFSKPGTGIEDNIVNSPAFCIACGVATKPAGSFDPDDAKLTSEEQFEEL